VKKTAKPIKTPTRTLLAIKQRPQTPTATRNDRQTTAKLFSRGRSQAVRLPKEFRMPGTEVRIHREGNRIVLEPLSHVPRDDVPRDAKGWPIGLWEKLHRLSAGLDPDEFQIPDDPVPPPITPLDQR